MKSAAALFCAGMLYLAHSQGAYAQKAIFLVRHADRLDGSVDSPLSTAGQTRAARLAVVFRHAGITSIYTSQWQRTMMTATPLATVLGIEPKIVPGMDIEKLSRQVRLEPPDGVVLIVGHHETIPLLLKSFGCSEDAYLGPGEYDNLFILLPNGKHPPALIRLHY